MGASAKHAEVLAGVEPRPGTVAVLGKAMAVIEQLAETGESTPALLAEQIAEPRTTVYRLLSSLRELGCVEPGRERGSYRLTLKLFRLGSSVIGRFDERAAALPVMQRLHEQTGETIFLCVRRASDAVCIERIDGAHVMLVDLRLGGALPLHLGAAPRALLAFEPETAWDEYLATATLEPRAPNTPLTREAIIAELRATRRRGYAVSDQDVTTGVASVGAPIYGHAGEVRAALSIGGIREVITGADLDVAELVVDGANEISKRLGHMDRGTISLPPREAN